LYMAVPVSLMAYFLVSTELFAFGHYVPVYPYHEGERDLYHTTLTVIGWFFLSAYLGKTLAFLTISSPEPATPVSRQRFAQTVEEGTNTAYSQLRGALTETVKVLIALLPAVFVAASAPFDVIYDRDTWEAGYSWQRAMVFADTLFWLSALVIPTIRSRWLKFTCLAVLVAAFASLGERQAPVALLLFVLVDRFVIGNKKILLHGLLGLLSAWILVVLISLRADALGGTVQVAIRLLRPEEMPLEAFSYAFNYMTNFSIIVNSIAMEYFPADAESFWYGISLLPSFIFDDTDNYLLKNSVLPYVPLPGFAFLVNFLGPLRLMSSAVVVYFLIEAYRIRFVRNRDTLDQLLYGALVIVPVLFSLQYNLRACSRLFYVLLFLYIAVSVLRRVTIRLPDGPVETRQVL